MRRAPAPGTRRADPQYAYAGHALHAEWTKTRTAGGAFWLLLAVIAATVAVGAAVAMATRCPAAPAAVVDRLADRLGVDPAALSLYGQRADPFGSSREDRLRSWR
ncbi:MAG: hypothetical protein ABSA53_12770 [Streptosporangiaceae bacterium]|jgi:hypothetical protein